jgi:hypothetical protein
MFLYIKHQTISQNHKNSPKNHKKSRKKSKFFRKNLKKNLEKVFFFSRTYRPRAPPLAARPPARERASHSPRCPRRFETGTIVCTRSRRSDWWWFQRVSRSIMRVTGVFVEKIEFFLMLVFFYFFYKTPKRTPKNFTKPNKITYQNDRPFTTHPKTPILSSQTQNSLQNPPKTSKIVNFRPFPAFFSPESVQKRIQKHNKTGPGGSGSRQ